MFEFVKGCERVRALRVGRIFLQGSRKGDLWCDQALIMIPNLQPRRLNRKFS